MSPFIFLIAHKDVTGNYKSGNCIWYADDAIMVHSSGGMSYSLRLRNELSVCVYSLSRITYIQCYH